jgi:MtrB/PioB family decaheme-associated outer membrane protein
MANLSYQRMTQDDAFLPYTVNTRIDGPLPVAGDPLVPLPRTDLDGEINNWFANLTLTGRPMPKLDVTGRYTFDLRDSDTPANTYQYVRTDAADQLAIDSERARVNKVYDFEKQKAELDGRYRLLPRATLSAGYAFEYIDRNKSEVEQTYEHSGNVKLMGSPTDRTNGWVRYLHAVKDGSTYDARVPFFVGFSPEHVEEEVTSAACNPGGVFNPNCQAFFENSSLMRKYYMADRTRDQVAGNLGFSPNDKFTIGISGRYTTDNYDGTQIGLTDRETLSGTLDMSYMANENLTTYAYYTHDFLSNHQVGCENCAPEPGAGIPANRKWEVENTDHANTVGAGFEWRNLFKEKVDVFVDLTYTKADTEVQPQAGPTFIDTNILPFPDIETTIYSLSLRGDYRINKQMKMRFGYLYEYFENVDWAFDNVGPTTIDIILATGETSPDYTAHVFGLSLVYDFDL